MILSLPALASAIAVVLVLHGPGWVAARRAGHDGFDTIAAGWASQALILLIAAIAAQLLRDGTSVLIIVPIAAAIGIAAMRLPRTAMLRPADRRMLVATVLVALLITAHAGLIFAHAATPGAEGVSFRGWARADMFKHVGHVAALAGQGLPPRDIFGAGLPLAYYWLYYPIPAAGTVLHGDAMAGFAAAGLCQTVLFWPLVMGLFVRIGLSPGRAALMVLVSWASLTLEGPGALIATGGDWRMASQGMEAGAMFSNLLGSSTLFRLNVFIPQHQMVLAGLIAWFLLYGRARTKPLPALAIAAHAPLAAAGLTSTLFGAACLVVYGAAQLTDPALGLWRRIAQIGLVGALAMLLVLAFGIVDPGFGAAATRTPMFATWVNPNSHATRFTLALIGLVPLYGLLLPFGAGALLWWLLRRRSANDRDAVFAALLLAIGLAIQIAVAVLIEDRRIGHEAQIRASLLAGLGIALGFALLWRPGMLAGRWRAMPWGALAIAVAAGGVTPVIDTIWHMRADGVGMALVPHDDLAVLRGLRKHSRADAQVVQYPEPTLHGGGGADSWAVVFGQRTVATSLRATRWNAVVDDWEASKRFYAGNGRPEAICADYVYLSRALHPASYDRLRERMGRSTTWEPAWCRGNACVFRRRQACRARGAAIR